MKSDQHYDNSQYRGFIIQDLNFKQVVGLLWADQNMRDFGDQERLLKSHERKSLWDRLAGLTEEEILLIDSPYLLELDVHKAHIDNVKIGDYN